MEIKFNYNDKEYTLLTYESELKEALAVDYDEDCETENCSHQYGCVLSITGDIRKSFDMNKYLETSLKKEAIKKANTTVKDMVREALIGIRFEDHIDCSVSGDYYGEWVEKKVINHEKLIEKIAESLMSVFKNVQINYGF